jgi:23S rRNA G2069 N7-methylase RlmK/C1962 C5-methylase RlmI
MKTGKAKPILDACCGSKMFWFDKENPRVHFNDLRKKKTVLCDGRVLEICPHTQYDFKKLKFKKNTFHLVVFDPPHLKSAGRKGWQALKYGSLGADWKSELKQGFWECFRVLKPNGVLIFKWNEHSIKVKDVLDVLGAEPLFGHRTMQNNKTLWLTFMKPESGAAP